MPEIHRTSIARGLFSILFLVAACDGRHDGPERSEGPASIESIPVLIADELLLELGDVEGDTEQTLDFVVGLRTLPAGDRIAVLDQGSAEILVFDLSGDLVERFGGEGDGPGEFRSPAGISRGAGDSVQVLDGRGMRVSVFGPDLEYAYEVPAAALSGDERFPFDVFFHDRFWVEGALAPDRRLRVVTNLDRRPFPSDREGFRRVRVAENDDLWIREESAAGKEPSRWIVVDSDGPPSHWVELPARFDPMEIRGDVVTGRWEGELDVHFVRRYRLTDSGRTGALPPWMTEAESPGGPLPAPDPDSVVAGMKSVLRNLATMQEIARMGGSSYTTRIDSLLDASGFELPEGLSAHGAAATGRGWSAVLTREGFPDICAFSAGIGTPAGLPAGVIVCGG